MLKHVRTFLLAGSLAVFLYPAKARIRQFHEARDGEHDFDFEIGLWKTRLRRLIHPLTGSTTWVEMEGTWSLNFANANDGVLSQPAIGEFKDGRGEFYDQEPLNGRAILVRFVILPLTPDSCRFEQSFSDDGGKTWEVNWIAIDTRVKN